MSSDPALDAKPPATPDRDRLADLIEAVAASQSKAAFGELFGFYAPRVKAYLRRLGAPDAQAEEIAQDCLLLVWRKAPLFDRRIASASTWVFRIARNRRIDLARRSVKPDPESQDSPLRPEPDPPADAVLVAQEAETSVRAALAALPADQQELVRLAFYEGLSHSEIAHACGLPLGTVKSRIRLAFAKMRGRLEDTEH